MKVADVRRKALALEAVTEEPHHDFSSFRVRGRIFVTIPPDGEHLHVLLPVEQQDQALALHPEFVERLYWGHKALGVRVALRSARPGAVHALVLAAYEARVARDARPRKRKASP